MAEKLGLYYMYYLPQTAYFSLLSPKMAQPKLFFSLWSALTLYNFSGASFSLSLRKEKPGSSSDHSIMAPQARLSHWKKTYDRTGLKKIGPKRSGSNDRAQKD